MPFMLLPFRPASDPSAARAFVRSFFSPSAERGTLEGERLMQELRMTEPPVWNTLGSVDVEAKWCRSCVVS